MKRVENKHTIYNTSKTKKTCDNMSRRHVHWVCFLLEMWINITANTSNVIGIKYYIIIKCFICMNKKHLICLFPL